MVIVAAGAASVSACGGPESVLSTHSKDAHNIALLWWWMLAAAAIVLFGSIGMLALGWFRRDKPGLPFFGTREDVPQGLVLVFGIAIPLVALVALFGVANIYLVGQTSPPAPRTTAMTIDVIGHQWWWEVRYDGGRVVTANEIHIPTHTRVNIVATTADVIHSFWIPALNRKIDMIPGMRNRVLLDASTAGTFRGQCSQFCGLQHAHMGMYVVAQSPARYRSWLANQERPAVTPRTSLEQAGERLFMSSQCESCHTIAGTPAQGEIGPNLTHLRSRFSLAGAEIPNTPRWLAAWIRNPQAIKPGTRMPDLGLRGQQITALVAYLDGLR
ncbi:MAG: cytochrome c oxidase subunit II [Solirubrobacteraceae bacterium]